MNSRKHCLIFRNAKKKRNSKPKPSLEKIPICSIMLQAVHKALKLLFLPAPISHEKFHDWNFYIQLTSKTYQNG